MGPMIRYALYTLPGALGAALALLLNADWRWVAAGLACYAASPPLQRTPRTMLLILGPLLIATGAPLASLFSVTGLVWLIISLLLAMPIFLYLGARVPLRGLAWYVVLPPLLLLPVVSLRVAPTFFASDIATRSQVVLLAAVLLLLGTILPWIRLPQRAAQAQESTYTPFLSRDAPERR